MGEKAKQFVVAEVEDDTDEQTADKYNVDGGYVPRIYFLGSDGKVMEDLWNVGTQYLENKFYYYEMSSVLRSMDKALKKFAEPASESESKKSEELKSEGKSEDKKVEEKSEEKKEDTKESEKSKDSETKETKE